MWVRQGWRLAWLGWDRGLVGIGRRLGEAWTWKGGCGRRRRWLDEWLGRLKGRREHVGLGSEKGWMRRNEWNAVDRCLDGTDTWRGEGEGARPGRVTRRRGGTLKGVGTRDRLESRGETHAGRWGGRSRDPSRSRTFPLASPCVRPVQTPVHRVPFIPSHPPLLAAQSDMFPPSFQPTQPLIQPPPSPSTPALPRPSFTQPPSNPHQASVPPKPRQPPPLSHPHGIWSTKHSARPLSSLPPSFPPTDRLSFHQPPLLPSRPSALSQSFSRPVPTRFESLSARPDIPPNPSSPFTTACPGPSMTFPVRRPSALPLPDSILPCLYGCPCPSPDPIPSRFRHHPYSPHSFHTLLPLSSPFPIPFPTPSLT
jgi:hypothetical protein